MYNLIFAWFLRLLFLKNNATSQVIQTKRTIGTTNHNNSPFEYKQLRVRIIMVRPYYRESKESGLKNERHKMRRNNLMGSIQCRYSPIHQWPPHPLLSTSVLLRGNHAYPGLEILALYKIFAQAYSRFLLLYLFSFQLHGEY